MIIITDKSKCTGCSACYSICPVSCIDMQVDEEGFYYPIANANDCIHCEECKRICPVLNINTPITKTKKVFICQNKSFEIRKDSTSGGVFTAIAQYVLERGGVVYGAEFDKSFRVKHGIAENVNDIGKFRGSKYVQSWMGDTFSLVQKNLKDGRWVLFSGTPCQVAGLNSFLGKKYDTLILMDIVCYSISSPSIWKQFLDHIGNKIPVDSIDKIKFRDKNKYGYEYSLMTFYNKNGEILYSEGPESNQMLRSFVSNTSTRPSCFKCRFKNVNHISDFTAWDCYNIYQYNKKFDDNLGTSHLMVNTAEGMKIIPDLQKYMNICEVNADQAIRSEPAITECASPSSYRDDFFAYHKSGKDVFNKFFLNTRRVRLERFLRHSLSRVGLYKQLKRLLKKYCLRKI